MKPHDAYSAARLRESGGRPGRSAAFLDRDGTINVDTGFTHRIEDLELLPNAVEGLRELAGMGLRLFVVSNQSGVAQGRFTMAQMRAFNRRLAETLAQRGVRIEAFHCCPFHPEGLIGRYRGHSPMRKPEPGMLLKIARRHGIDLSQSFMIGDRMSDVEAGRRAGCRTVLLKTGLAGSDSDAGHGAPDLVAADLLDAARKIRRIHRPD